MGNRTLKIPDTLGRKFMTTSTGFGSWTIDLAVVVQKSFDERLIEQGWKVVSSDEHSTTFSYVYSNRKKGDDERALWEVGYAIPKDVPFEAWKIDWDKSVY